MSREPEMMQFISEDRNRMPKQRRLPRNIAMNADKKQLASIIERYEKAMFTVTRRINAAIRERALEELTLEQYSVLRYMHQRERCTSTEIADIFCVGKSSVTAIVTRLADKGFIERIPDDTDRRVTLLRPTAEGRKLVTAMEERIQELLSGLMRHFDKSEALQFIETFEKLANLLTQPDIPAAKPRESDTDR